MGTDKVADSSYQSASSLQDTVSPRAASNSRRKRKRKNSHSENRGKQSSTSRASQSPINEKDLCEAGSGNLSQKESVSPPIGGIFSYSSLALTPEPLLTPKSPQEELDPRLTSKSPVDLRCTPKSSSQGRPRSRSSSTPDDGVGGLSPTPLDVQQPGEPGARVHRSNSGANPSSGPVVTPAGCGEDETKAADCKTALFAHPKQASRNNSGCNNTPSSSAPRGKGKSKRKSGSNASRTRLTMKFEKDTAEVAPRMVGRNEKEVSDKPILNSPTASAPAKGVWSSVRYVIVI